MRILYFLLIFSFLTVLPYGALGLQAKDLFIHCR